MALFTKKTKEEKVKKEKVVVTRDSATLANNLDVHSRASTVKVFLKPRITEKATLLAEKNVYTFDVPRNANKQSIAVAVKELFKVTPVKVAIVRTMGKAKFTKGRLGKTAESKKAYVHLKAGDKIDFV